MISCKTENKPQPLLRSHLAAPGASPLSLALHESVSFGLLGALLVLQLLPTTIGIRCQILSQSASQNDISNTTNALWSQGTLNKPHAFPYTSGRSGNQPLWMTVTELWKGSSWTPILRASCSAVWGDPFHMVRLPCVSALWITHHLRQNSSCHLFCLP